MLNIVMSLLLSAAAAPTGGWPDLNVPAEGIDLFHALTGRTLEGQDAVSVFLALVRPGQYRVRAVNRDFDLRLEAEPFDRHRVSLRLMMSHAGLELGHSFLVHTGGDNGADSDQFELKTMSYGDAPALRLSLASNRGAESLVRVTFQSGVRRIRFVALSGPVLDRFRALAPSHLTETPMNFRFVDWRPPSGLELDCRKLLHRLENHVAD